MTERVTISDASLVTELERWVLSRLQGTIKEPGLYFSIARGVKDWETYQRMVGHVHAYEAVLNTLMALRQRDGGNGDAEEVVTFTRAGMN